MKNKKYIVYTCNKCERPVSWRYGSGSMDDFIEGTQRPDKPKTVESDGKTCYSCNGRPNEVSRGEKLSDKKSVDGDV